MKHLIQELLTQALQALKTEGKFQLDDIPTIQVERTRDKKHGDFASNVALSLAKAAKAKPRDIAQAIIDALPQHSAIRHVDIAGPGFINFFISEESSLEVLQTIASQGDNFGCAQKATPHRIHLEFVSANPTGPLHVGHGRGAAYGASLANLLRAAGSEVHCEYYVNDAGRQMDILALSVWLRYLSLLGHTFSFPSNAYQGDYVIAIAKDLNASVKTQYLHEQEAVWDNIPADEPQGGDKEQHVDALIERAKQLLGEEDYLALHRFGLEAILDDIREDLAAFGVNYESWFSERELTETNSVQQSLETLKNAGFTYEKDGAIWFKATDFDDEKDRVLVRANGQITYFGSDVAYHLNKFERGYDQLIDIWGADHHGYIARVKASVEALQKNPDDLTVLLVQFATLYRGSERVQMSTRSGSFVTLRQLREEVGSDAARFFYVMRKAEQHMDFDLELATSHSNENPVYYIQYAHARISSVLQQAKEKGQAYDASYAKDHLALLKEPQEKDLLTNLAKYPELIQVAARDYEPHQIAHYLRDLANCLHTYYNAHHFLVADKNLTQARLCLISAVQQVLKNGLQLLGVSAKETM